MKNKMQIVNPRIQGEVDTDLRSKKEEAYSLKAKEEVGLKSIGLKWV